MSNDNATVLIDAKEEYNKQLISAFKDNIFTDMKHVYKEAENMCFQENNPENVLMLFQDFLSKIPKWNMSRINKSFNKVRNKCDYIDDLIKIIYITHIKILTIVSKGKANKKINIKIPTGNSFYHLCLIDVARELWKSPYLLSHHLSKYEYQKHIRELEKIIADTILETIRKQLPIKTILQDYLDTDNDLLNNNDNSNDNNSNDSNDSNDNNLNDNNSNNFGRTSIKDMIEQDLYNKNNNLKREIQNELKNELNPSQSKEQFRKIMKKQKNIKPNKLKKLYDSKNIQRNVFNKKSNKLKSLLNRNAQLMSRNNEEENNLQNEEPEVKPEVEPEVKPEIQLEPEPEVKPEVKPEPEPEVKPEKNQNQNQSQNQNKSQNQNQNQNQEQEPEPEPEPELEQETRLDNNQEVQKEKELENNNTLQEINNDDLQNIVSDIENKSNNNDNNNNNNEIMLNNQFSKHTKNNNKSNLNIDSLDNLDFELEDDDMEDVNLREIQKQRNEILKLKENKKKNNFTFFNDAPMF